MDVYINEGFLDSAGWVVTLSGLFSYQVAPVEGQTVLSWNDTRYKGALAGAWLLAITSSVIQLWLYKRAGEDPEDSWK